MLITIFSIIVLIFSIVIHEVAHGAMALQMGDPTAKYAGRLTLNPIKHLDPIGSVFLPVILVLIKSPILIGWAKPVPINPYNFRDQKWGELKVSLAGPATNLLIALVFGLLIRFPFLPSYLSNAFGIITAYNLILGIFNLVPIPPLDGSHILFAFFPYSMENIKIFLNQWGMFILLILIFVIPQFFNILIALVNLIFKIIAGVSFY